MTSFRRSFSVSAPMSSYRLLYKETGENEDTYEHAVQRQIFS